jgi:hypothetical protein
MAVRRRLRDKVRWVRGVEEWRPWKKTVGWQRWDLHLSLARPALTLRFYLGVGPRGRRAVCEPYRWSLDDGKDHAAYLYGVCRQGLPLLVELEKVLARRGFPLSPRPELELSLELLRGWGQGRLYHGRQLKSARDWASDGPQGPRDESGLVDLRDELWYGPCRGEPLACLQRLFEPGRGRRSTPPATTWRWRWRRCPATTRSTAPSSSRPWGRCGRPTSRRRGRTPRRRSWPASTSPRTASSTAKSRRSTGASARNCLRR